MQIVLAARARTTLAGPISGGRRSQRAARIGNRRPQRAKDLILVSSVAHYEPQLALIVL